MKCILLLWWQSLILISYYSSLQCHTILQKHFLLLSISCFLNIFAETVMHFFQNDVIESSKELNFFNWILSHLNNWMHVCWIKSLCYIKRKNLLTSKGSCTLSVFYIAADGSDKSTRTFVSGDALTSCTSLMGSTRQRERQVCEFSIIFH